MSKKHSEPANIWSCKFLCGLIEPKMSEKIRGVEGALKLMLNVGRSKTFPLQLEMSILKKLAVF